MYIYYIFIIPSPDSDTRPRREPTWSALVPALIRAPFPVLYEAQDLYDSPRDARYPLRYSASPLYMFCIFRILKPSPETVSIILFLYAVLDTQHSRQLNHVLVIRLTLSSPHCNRPPNADRSETIKIRVSCSSI